MLTSISAAPDHQAACAAIVAVQHELLAATASRLIDADLEGPDRDLALRAIASGSPVAERRGGTAAAAVALGESGGIRLVAVHDLETATPLTLALADERLTLTAALLGGHDLITSWADAAAIAAALAGDLPNRASDVATAADGASGHRVVANADAVLNKAARLLSIAAGASRLIVARVANGVVTSVVDSTSATRSSEQSSRLKLAAGEAFDLGLVDATTPLPPGLTDLAGGGTLAAATATVGRRSAVIIALGTGDAKRLLPLAMLVAAVRPARPPILPPVLVAAVAAGMPWPVAWSAERRYRVARIAIIATPLLILLVPVPTSVDAAATIEALNQRIVTAPFDARIASVAVSPGDSVRAGRTVLLQLDARAAENERAEITANLQSALALAEAAAIDGRSDEERIDRLRAAQFSARAEILTLQIAAAVVTAPIDGIVAGDDLRKRTGGPVSRGETLLTVAAPGTYRVEVRVPDRDIGGVHVGQALSIALKARPLDRPRGTVRRIYPLAEIEDGDNIFRVVAELDDHAAGLLPGMEGRAAIRTGWAPLGWQLVSAPLRWVRLKLWI